MAPPTNIRLAKPLAVLAALVAACLPAAAALVPSGGEITVAERQSDGLRQPAPTLLAGGALVAWDERDGGLMLRRFDADGAAVSAAVVLVASEPEPGEQSNDQPWREVQEPALALRADGSVLAVWVEAKLKHDPSQPFAAEDLVVSQQVMARFFDVDAAGLPVSRQWALSSLDGVASRPTVARVGDRFLVAWQERGGAQPGVHLGVVDRGGPLGDLLVAPRALRPAIAAGGEGALLTWEKCCGAHRGAEIFAHRFDRRGRGDGGRFRVASDQPRGARAPAVAGRPGGDFLVAFERPVADGGNGARVHGQLVGRRGELVGGELALSSGPGTSHTAPVPVALSTGGWAVGWVTWVNNFRVGATVGGFTALGNAAGNPVDLNDRPVLGLELALAAGPDGRLLGVWEGFDTLAVAGLRGRFVRAEAP